MYEQLRNQKAHLYAGARNCVNGHSSTPFRSSGSGMLGKWLARPVLIEVSVCNFGANSTGTAGG